MSESNGIDRLPPQSREAERSVLGSLLRDNGVIGVWDTRTGQPVRRLTGHKQGIPHLAVSPDGTLAAAGSGQKGTVTVWDLA